MMSANITAASTPCRRTGCSVTSAQSSGVWATSQNACRSRIARYSGSERPACRMNHTGVRSTGSRRAARTSSGSTRLRLASRVHEGLSPSAGATRSPVAPQAGAVEQVRVEVENAGAAAVAERARSSRTTGSTTATTRSSGTASAPPPRRSRPASASVVAARARADPARALPVRVRPRGRAPRLVLGARQPDARPGRRRRSARRRAERGAACGSSRCRTGRSGSARRTRRATRVVAGAIDWPGGLFRRRPRALAPYEPGPGRVPGFARRCSARRVLPGVELERLAESRACRRSPRRPTSRGSTTAASSLRRRSPCGGRVEPDGPVRARPRCGRRPRGRRGDAERRARRPAANGEVDDVCEPRRVARPERVADREDRRRDGVAPAQQVEQRVMATARSRAASSNDQRIGVRKNHGRSAAVRMCSTSRKSTFRHATSSARPATKPAKSTASGIAGQTVARASGHEDEREDDEDREHHRERDRLRRDHRERDELAREADLLDQLGAVDHRARRRLQRDREEDPAGEAGEQVERVVRDAAVLDQHPEDDEVDAEQDERIQQRPGDAEHRALVLGLEIAPEEVREQLAVAEQVGVDRHRPEVV